MLMESQKERSIHNQHGCWGYTAFFFFREHVYQDYGSGFLVEVCDIGNSLSSRRVTKGSLEGSLWLCC